MPQKGRTPPPKQPFKGKPLTFSSGETVYVRADGRPGCMGGRAPMSTRAKRERTKPKPSPLPANSNQLLNAYAARIKQVLTPSEAALYGQYIRDVQAGGGRELWTPELLAISAKLTADPKAAQQTRALFDMFNLEMPPDEAATP